MSNNLVYIPSVDEAEEVMSFIDKEWKKGHILGVDEEYFLYEYKNGDYLNFVISRNSSNINGILGFLKSSSDNSSTVWTTMWKVLKSSETNMLGIELLNYVRNQGYSSIMSNGINPKTAGIYKYLGYKVGSLTHYFILNEAIHNYKIALINESVRKKSDLVNLNNNFSLLKIDNSDELKKFDYNEYRNALPYKDFNYFKKRFFEHPIYKYDLYGAYFNQKLVSFIVTRIAKHLDATCMRIVDFYGQENALSSLVQHLSTIMYLESHEYIDLLSAGMSESIIFDAGFNKLDLNSDNIVIPNYFEPFIRRNIEISYFTDAPKNSNLLRVFKADGDQDRPSQILS